MPLKTGILSARMTHDGGVAVLPFGSMNSKFFWFDQPLFALIYRAAHKADRAAMKVRSETRRTLL
jgi:hypothetical protein